MKSSEDNQRGLYRNGESGQLLSSGATLSSALHLVNAHELQNLRQALAHGWVPVDLQAKLATLADSDLLHHFIRQNSQLFIALLLAAQEGSFPNATPAERERLLRVLAYVRKEDDAIPDHTPGGFADDHDEVRAASTDFNRLLQEFKRWRLQHQVPAIWCKNSGSMRGCVQNDTRGSKAPPLPRFARERE
jgi:hypothetical protein